MRGAIAYDDPDDDKTPVPGEEEDEARTIVMERRAIAAAAPRVPSSSPPAAEDQRLTLFDPHCVPSRWRRVAAWLRHAGRSLARLLQPVIALPMLPPLPPPKLLPADQNDLRWEGAALRHPTRGMLSRCAIRGAE